MEDKKLLKTIVICISVVVCFAIAAYSYYEANRYEVVGGGLGVLDKYTKEVIKTKFPN